MKLVISARSFLPAIVLDRNPPDELSLIINEGNEWVRNPARRTSVQLNARGASHFMLSEDPEFGGGMGFL
jgi:hypothetical protein